MAYLSTENRGMTLLTLRYLLFNIIRCIFCVFEVVCNDNLAQGFSNSEKNNVKKYMNKNTTADNNNNSK